MGVAASHFAARHFIGAVFIYDTLCKENFPHNTIGRLNPRLVLQLVAAYKIVLIEERKSEPLKSRPFDLQPLLIIYLNTEMSRPNWFVAMSIDREIQERVVEHPFGVIIAN